MESIKIKKTVGAFLSVLGIGTLIPVIASFIINGTSSLHASNFVFASGLLVATAGCAILIISFGLLKAKIRKLRIGEELAVEKKERLKWEYICLAAGAALMVVSYIITFF